MDVTRQNKQLYDRGRKRSGERTKSGPKKSKFASQKFLAWDGEGLEKNGVQVYGLLANSNGDYWVDTNGLSTVSCLYALTDESYTNNTTHVCFGASYDVNQMLADIPEYLLRDLQKGYTIRWREFDLEYRARKNFTVRRYRMEQRNDKIYRVFNPQTNQYIVEKTVTLWDVFGFFQKKFVSVCEEWFAGTKYQHKYETVIEDIKVGKQKRGQFTVDEVKSFVLPYCIAECEALRDIMYILHGYIMEAGLVLSRWDGAGAIAAALMKKHEIKSFIRRGPKLDIPAEPSYVTLAAEFAYYGGWIECFKFGDIHRPIYHYDIRSAYPDKSRKLLSLMHGTWKMFTFDGKYLPVEEMEVFLRNLPSFFVAHIEWNCPKKYVHLPCPFSWRNKQGNVSRPLHGRGWQWSPEILAAMDCCPDVEIKITRVYAFYPTQEIYPFAFLENIYKSRAQHKREKKGVEKVEKLEMNSTYGKTAQSLGYDAVTERKPPYHCLVYAGLITSMTRAQILRAVSQKLDAIVSIATDGIYSLEPLDLIISDNLGDWEFTLHESLTIVQSGFYWYSTKNEKGEIKEQHYYRGFNEDSITRDQVVRAYRFGEIEVGVETTRFITLGAAVGLNDFTAWRTWRTAKRMLDLWMRNSKRIWIGESDPLDPDIHLSRAKVMNPRVFEDNPDALESHKYSFDWDGEQDFDGQSSRKIAEDMFEQELCTDE